MFRHEGHHHQRYGGPEVLTVADLPDPVPAAGEVLIRVRAFGLNHAEAYMRSGAWGKVAQVPGIECAGTVQADPSDRLAHGTPVVAITAARSCSAQSTSRWLASHYSR